VALDVINILTTENKPNTAGGGGNASGVLTGMNGATGGLGSMLNNGLSENTGGNNNLILPPGTLHATYVSKPKLTEKAQLEQAQLTLGLKRTVSRAANAKKRWANHSFFLSATKNRRGVLEKECCFFEKARQPGTGLLGRDGGRTVQPLVNASIKRGFWLFYKLRICRR
jgi:hypothetical protein